MTYTGAIRFYARNLVDEGTVTASSAATPASRVQHYRPSRRWYATGKTSEFIQVDFGKEVLLSHAAYVGFNVNTQGLGQIRLSNSPTFAGADVYNSGDVEMWLPVAGLGSDALGESLGGYPVLNTFNDYRAYRTIAFGGLYSARYMRAYLKNPTNTLISQVGFGWLYAGQPFQPSWNFDFDWNWDWQDPSEIIETETSDFVRARKTVRVMNLRVADMSEAEAIGPWNTILRAIGTKKTMLIEPFPEGATPLRYATTLYGRKVGGPGISQPPHLLYESGITVKELAA
jgi:hypothetical protein